MTMTAVEYPIAPTVTKRKGTLLDAATEVGQFTWHDGRDLFESANCLQFNQRSEFCAPNAKDFDQSLNWVDGFRFAAYGGVTCKAIGMDMAEQKAAVAKAFATGESAAVEAALMEIRFAESTGADPQFPGTWAAPADITPSGGAVTPKVGIALLEEYAGNLYTGAPTLHVPISIASLILGVDGAAFEGNILRTKFGSKMAAGAGYSANLGPTGVAGDPGERWLYATGEVVYSRSADLSVQSMDYSTNEVFAMAERAYLVAVDCFTAAIRVTVE